MERRQIMTFELTEKQKEKLAAWKVSLLKEPPSAVGGAFSYCFTPTSLGLGVRVEYFDGQSIDITSYEEW